jgi:hypothetical protein
MIHERLTSKRSMLFCHVQLKLPKDGKLFFSSGGGGGRRASTFLSSLSSPKGLFSYLGVALGFSIYSIWKFKQLPLQVVGSLIHNGIGIWASNSNSTSVTSITPVSINIDFKHFSTPPVPATRTRTSSLPGVGNSQPRLCTSQLISEPS